MVYDPESQTKSCDERDYTGVLQLKENSEYKLQLVLYIAILSHTPTTFSFP